MPGGLVHHQAGYSYRRLLQQVPTGIYECNSKCKCKQTCLNRVAQKPMRAKLQVFKTKERGWGIRTLCEIPRGAFICIYVGNLYSSTESNEVGKKFGDEYFAGLDFIEVVEGQKEGYESEADDESGSWNKENKSASSSSSSSVSEEKKAKLTSTRKFFGKNEEPYVMDAREKGNIGRYLNHSCHPNVFVQNCLVDTHDLRFPWLAFFASHCIMSGQELCWDYGYEINQVEGKRIDCSCGAPTCRGRLL
jgi:histone-lysine N-methyltransferase SETDB1